MAVTTRDIRKARAGGAVQPRLGGWRIDNPYLAVIIGGLVLVALYLLIGAAIRSGQVLLDDMRYGRPRTTQVTVVLGHGDSVERPSYVMALNLNRQIVLVELPGGDPAKAKAQAGPYLFGPDEDLTVAQISAQDLDNDGQKDVILEVRHEKIVYLNRDGGLRLATAEELTQITARGQP